MILQQRCVMYQFGNNQQAACHGCTFLQRFNFSIKPCINRMLLFFFFLQVCIVLEGSVTLSIETNKGTAKVVDLLPQEILCCGAILEQAEACTAVASSPSKLLLIPESVFLDCLNPAVLSHVSHLKRNVGCIQNTVPRQNAQIRNADCYVG